MAPQPIPQPPPAPQLEVVTAIERLHESIRDIASPAKAQAAGESYLTVPIGQALPKPPDVAVEAKVPGGVLLPCVPGPKVPAVPLVNRTEYLLQFPFPQGFRLELTRIHINLPVWMEELELEKKEEEETIVTGYATEEEAKKANERIGGGLSTSQQIQPIGFNTQYVSTNKEYLRSFAANFLKEKIKTTTRRSVLPITPVVVVRLKGPDGELWSSAFDAPMHYLEGLAGTADGTGLIDEYADLQNSITLNNQRVYSLALFLLVPTTVATNTQIGPEQKNKEVLAGNGAITIFYTVDPAHVGK